MTLTPEETRVLGCLLEKERTTPDAYPLSLNGLMAACNQSTNRMPVVHYDEPTVETALDELRERGLVRRGVYPGSRVIKYRHVLDEVLKLAPGEAAVLCVLLLRGPQTAGELKTRTERLHRFADLAEVEDAVGALAGREEPLAAWSARESGRKEARIRELLGAGGETGAFGAGEAVGRSVDAAADGPEPARPAAAVDQSLGRRVAALEAQILSLRAEVEALRDGLGG